MLVVLVLNGQNPLKSTQRKLMRLVWQRPTQIIISPFKVSLSKVMVDFHAKELLYHFLNNSFSSFP